jgi:hypothetical protein
MLKPELMAKLLNPLLLRKPEAKIRTVTSVLACKMVFFFQSCVWSGTVAQFAVGC